MKTYDLKLTLDQIKLLFAGLGETPTKIGMPLSLEIKRQMDVQDAAANRAAEAASKPAAAEPEPESSRQTQSPKTNGHLGHFAASAQTG